MSEVTGAILRVQLVKLPSVISHMRGLKLLLRQVVAQYSNIKLRAVEDVHGDAGTLLTLTFDSKAVAKAFQASLSRNSILVKKTRLTSTLMSDWGLHIYYRNKSLVDKHSICGHHSVWELQENAFARDYSYGKGTLPTLDDVASRTLLFPIPVGLDERDTKALLRMFELSCRHVASIVPDATNH
jgi:dTDP-4-amino-4,6-dideoxygalactose transaminase